MTSPQRPFKLLLLGARVGLIEACRATNTSMTIYNTERGKTLPAPHGLARVIEGPALADAERIAYDLLRHDERSFDGVVTGYEDGVFSAAVLQAFYGTAQRNDLRTAIAFRDKREQKRKLDGQVPQARLWPIAALTREALPAEARFPLVIKPANGVATSLTFTVRDADDFEAVTRQLRASDTSAFAAFVLEEFVTGEEWHLNGWVSRNELQWFSASRYGAPLIQTKDGAVVSSVTLKPSEHKKTFAELRGFLSKALQALELRDGVFHLECFRQEQGFVFSECAARIGGGYVAETIRHMFGVDLYKVAVRLALGEHVPAPRNVPERGSYGYVQLPAPDEPSRYTPSVADLQAFPGVVEAEYEFRLGDEIPDVRKNSSARAGKVIVQADDEPGLCVGMNEVLAYARRPGPLAARS